ncbi:MAG: hypothetical protein JXB07_03885 [Anaerolineae bacterium]|nr:hypothetical protein [Anaerolineae bacterium]
MNAPFRWNLAKREQLGRLVQGEPPILSAEFMSELRTCAARVLAFASDADLVFIGRSPENLFDYLSGVLEITSWSDRCSLMNISLRVKTDQILGQAQPDTVALGRELFAAYGLSPEQIIHHPRPIAFIDLVATGKTFGHLAAFLTLWAREQQMNVRALKQKLRFVGITWRSKTSPKTWRWQQHVPWAGGFPPGHIKNVSIPGLLWSYWGNEQPKVTSSNPPWRWGTDAMRQPVHTSEHLAALNLAVYLYDRGNSMPERLAMAECLTTTKTPGMRERWYRSLILELRRAG